MEDSFQQLDVDVQGAGIGRKRQAKTDAMEGIQKEICNRLERNAMRRYKALRIFYQVNFLGAISSLILECLDHASFVVSESRKSTPLPASAAFKHP
jgi:hypothetical protein